MKLIKFLLLSHAILVSSAHAMQMQPEIGKWQALYWHKGPEAAKSYCDQMLTQLDEILISIKSLGENAVEDSKLLFDKLYLNYENKKFNYLPDTLINIGAEDYSKGRAEPGRTPLNYPDFRHRFDKLELLINFLDNKIRIHQDNISILKDLFIKYYDNKFLSSLQAKHELALSKWQERKVRAENSPDWLLPTSKKPLDLTNISWAHQQGYFGQGAEVIVLEPGADINHDALAGAFLPGSDQVKKDKHGTHVCGIIAGKNTGAAPEAKIKLAYLGTPERCEEIKNSHIEIINYSGDVRSKYDKYINTFYDKTSFLNNLYLASNTLPAYLLQNLLKILQNPNEDEAKMQLQDLWNQDKKALNEKTAKTLENKLVIQAIGNDGVIITDRHSYMVNGSPLLKIIEEQDGILVVNLLPDGVYPSETSNFPGERYADYTLCAVGTNVISTLPNNEYGPLSGTSMAAPFVYSVALLLNSAFPSLSKSEIRRSILESATPIILDTNGIPVLVSDPDLLKNYSQEQIALSRRFFGRGRLNAKAAIEFALKLSESQASASDFISSQDFVHDDG